MDFTLTSRYERKYFIDAGLAMELKGWLSSFIHHDKFSRDQVDKKYSICSLYLDNEYLSLYHQTLYAEKNRYKLRLRTYGDNPHDPVFVEVKKRMDQVVHKERCMVSRQVCHELVSSLVEQKPVKGVGKDSATNRFMDLSRTIQAKPLLLVRYKREAFDSGEADPVRVTFDTGLSTRLSPEGEISHSGSGWTDVIVPGVILEIKYSNIFPGWLQTMTDSFGLRYLSVPKYGFCVEASPSLAPMPSN